MHNNKEIHLTCSCCSHELHLERDSFDEHAPLWYGSFWLRGYAEKSYWWRWRMVWHVIKTGKPYGDEVVLTRENLEELRDYANEQLKLTDSAK